MSPDRTAAPPLLDAFGVVVSRLPAEDRIVLRRWGLPQRVRAPQPNALTDAVRPTCGARAFQPRVFLGLGLVGRHLATGDPRDRKATANSEPRAQKLRSLTQRPAGPEHGTPR